jgi:hypothetical protein
MLTIDVWLRGPVYGIPQTLVPVAHALLQAREDVARVVAGVPGSVLGSRPGGAASPAFHMFHMAHALDRLMTYARGGYLSDAQREALAMEREGDIDPDPAELLHLVETTIDWAIRQLRCTPESTLAHERVVGKAGSPSSVLGLLFHAAEHTTRHTGQLITTLKILQAGSKR